VPRDRPARPLNGPAPSSNRRAGNVARYLRIGDLTVHRPGIPGERPHAGGSPSRRRGGRGEGSAQRLKDGCTCAKRDFLVPEASKPGPHPGPPAGPEGGPENLRQTDLIGVLERLVAGALATVGPSAWDHAHRFMAARGELGPNGPSPAHKAAIGAIRAGWFADHSDGSFLEHLWAVLLRGLCTMPWRPMASGRRSSDFCV
jgi:hypothetical protein